MSTITAKHLIDDLIANDGRYEDDPDVALIVEYTNAYGAVTWGVTWVTETPERQARYLIETEYVRAPKLLWSRHGEDPPFHCARCGVIYPAHRAHTCADRRQPAAPSQCSACGEAWPCTVSRRGYAKRNEILFTLRTARASWRRLGVRIVTRGTRRPPRCGDPSPPETPRARIGPYRCTLTVGHDGPHVMTSHPLHPAWPR